MVNLYDEKIENAILGALIIDPNSFTLIQGKITSQSFYFEENKSIYSAIEKIATNGGKVDYLTISKWCKENKKEITAIELAKKSNGIYTAAHIEEHADILSELEQKRKISTACEIVLHKLNSEKVSETTSMLSQVIDDVLNAISKESNIHSFKDSVLESREQMYFRMMNYKNGVCCTGISTGLRTLDNMIGGFKNGELIILAGRPSMGKTAVMLHFAISAAKQNYKVLIFSLEMDNISLANRAILANTYIPSGRFNDGSLSQCDIDELESQLTNITSLPIIIDDSSISSIAKIESVAKLHRMRGNCDFILIDYLGLIDSPRKNGTREQEVAEISKKMKSLARKLDVPVILLSQLSRECEKRADKVPILADLRESGAIEQDADKVIFVFRPAYYQMTNSIGELIPNDCGELIVAKNRNGKIGSAKFKHNESITRIEDYE